MRIRITHWFRVGKTLAVDQKLLATPLMIALILHISFIFPQHVRKSFPSICYGEKCGFVFGSWPPFQTKLLNLHRYKCHFGAEKNPQTRFVWKIFWSYRIFRANWRDIIFSVRLERESVRSNCGNRVNSNERFICSYGFLRPWHSSRTVRVENLRTTNPSSLFKIRRDHDGTVQSQNLQWKFG